MAAPDGAGGRFPATGVTSWRPAGGRHRQQCRQPAPCGYSASSLKKAGLKGWAAPALSRGLPYPRTAAGPAARGRKRLRYGVTDRLAELAENHDPLDRCWFGRAGPGRWGRPCPPPDSGSGDWLWPGTSRFAFITAPTRTPCAPAAGRSSPSRPCGIRPCRRSRTPCIWAAATRKPLPPGCPPIRPCVAPSGTSSPRAARSTPSAAVTWICVPDWKPPPKVTVWMESAASGPCAACWRPRPAWGRGLRSLGYRDVRFTGGAPWPASGDLPGPRVPLVAHRASSALCAPL